MGEAPLYAPSLRMLAHGRGSPLEVCDEFFYSRYPMYSLDVPSDLRRPPPPLALDFAVLHFFPYGGLPKVRFRQSNSTNLILMFLLRSVRRRQCLGIQSRVQTYATHKKTHPTGTLP